jgi:HemX protein
MMDRTFLWVAEGIYLLSFLVSLFFIRARLGSPYPGTVAMVGIGFAAHSAGLYLRGVAIHACPITNLFESLWFIAWTIVLIYLVTGALFRVSFLGAFAIPVVAALGLVALILPLDQPRDLTPFKSPWLGLHASFSLVAYGAFAVACITGVMYLVQEHQLKTRKLYPLFHRLPPIESLDVINYRLLLAGLGVLTLGMIFGFLLGAVVMKKVPPKMTLSFLIWGVYAALLAARMTGHIRGRKVALGSVALFLFLMATLRFMISPQD